MCFQIEKRSCGSGVIAAQSLKSSSLWLGERCTCDAGCAAPPILRQHACNCVGSIIVTRFNFTCKEKMDVSTAAVFGHPASAPPQAAQNLTVGRGVMCMCCAPNSATTCMQLRGEHHCNSFQLHMQRKDGRFNGCRFWAPGKCTPSGSPKSHCGEGGDVCILF